VKIIKYVPNTLSVTRIFLVLTLLVLWFFLPYGFVMSPLFLIIYTLAGITDMLDGPIARKFNVATPLGANLDGLADYAFIVVAIFLIVPVLMRDGLHLGIVVFIIAGIIALKSVGVVVGYMRYGQLMMMHTYASKSAAMIAFLLPLLLHITGLGPNIIFGLFGVYVYLFLIEEIAINSVLPAPQRDISGIRQALRIRREFNDSK
jgi:CDP-diacylglycerol--glycerol-3-phosphate 3-phosphatidyltransferase